MLGLVTMDALEPFRTKGPTQENYTITYYNKKGKHAF
jgi:fumarylacetoacetase